MTAPREIELLAEQLKSPDKMIRMKALVMLVNKGNPSISPVLEKLAAKDDSVEIRYYAKKALKMMEAKAAAAPAPQPAAVPQAPPGSPHRVQPMEGVTPDAATVRKLLASPDYQHKVQAVRTALEHKLVETAEDFAEQLTRETNPVALSALVIALGKLGGPAHTRKLVKLLQHPDARVRANTVDALEASGDGAVYPYLIQCLRDEDNRCRANAARALRTYGPVNQMATLKLMLESDEVWMQDSAAYVLGFITDPAVFALFKIALASRHRVVRDQARASLQRLKERGSERAADMLARIGGERQGVAEEELFQRLAAATAPPAPEPEPPAPEPALPAPAPVSEPAVPPEPELIPAALVESRPSAGAFFRKAPRTQAKRKSAEEAFASLCEVRVAGDIDFLAKEELQEERVFDKLRLASEDTAVDREEATLTASQRASRALENLGKLEASPADQLPQQREEARMTRAREKLETDLKDIAAAKTTAEAYKDKFAKEDSIFARLQALAA